MSSQFYPISIIVLLLPFERLLTFEVAGFTIKPAYLLAVIFIGWYLLRHIYSLIARFKNGQVNPIFVRDFIKKIAAEEYLLLIFVAWSYFSSIWSLDGKRTLVLSTLLTFLVLVFIIFRRLINEKIRQKISQIFIWSGIAVSIFAIIQLLLEPLLGYQAVFLREIYSSRVFGFARPQGTFLEPLYLADYLIIATFLLNNELRMRNKGYWKLTIILIVFILALSRGAYLGLAIGSLVYLATGFYYKKITQYFVLKILGTFIMALVISFTLIYLVAGGGGIKTFFNHASRASDLAPSNEIERLKNRTVAVNNAKESINNHFLLGVGLGAFGALPQYRNLREVGEMQTVNNQYLEVFAELGVVGFMLFLAIIYLAISYQLQAARRGIYDNVVYLAALVALLVQYFTFSALNLLYIWVFLAIIWPAKRVKSS